MLMEMIEYIKDVKIIVDIVMDQEMILIIIVKNVGQVSHF